MTFKRLQAGGIEIRTLRYDFARGEAREVVRRFSDNEVWGNNALMQHLRRDGRKRDRMKPAGNGSAPAR